MFLSLLNVVLLTSAGHITIKPFGQRVQTELYARHSERANQRRLSHGRTPSPPPLALAANTNSQIPLAAAKQPLISPTKELTQNQSSHISGKLKDMSRHTVVSEGTAGYAVGLWPVNMWSTAAVIGPRVCCSTVAH